MLIYSPRDKSDKHNEEPRETLLERQTGAPAAEENPDNSVREEGQDVEEGHVSVVHNPLPIYRTVFHPEGQWDQY